MSDTMELTPVTSAKDGDPLQTKYYCKVENSENMKVIMEMRAVEQKSIEPLPLRYVLVIDVSGSMAERIGLHQKPLIERVKLFAELAVRKMNPRDFIAVVTFSDTFYVDIPMTKMTPNNKMMVRNRLKHLETKTNTNLECGLMGALQVINTAPKMYRPSRDCIILFTDGEANEGELNAKKLIEKYKRVQSNMNRNSDVPVSAFTIGGYRPDLLIEISKQLGSESFYWLDDEDDFEADMLIPIFLRETTHISDVRIKMDAKANCYFNPLDYNAAHLTAVEKRKVKIKKNKKSKKTKEPTILSYFLHSLPDDCIKNLPFHLTLPHVALNGERIVDITIQYLDANLMPRTMQDYITLSTTSLMSSISEDAVVFSNFTGLSAHLREISAFIMRGNKEETAWSEAQEVIFKIAEEECKIVGVKSITQASEYANDDAQNPHASFREAFEEINMIRNRTVQLLPNDGETTGRLDEMIERWSSRMTHANDIVAKKDSRNFSLLTSMASSISTESPTSLGIFRGRQPFMTEVLENSLLEERKNLEVARRIHSRENINIYDLKEQFRRVKEAGHLEKMEECMRDFKGLELFGYDVDEEYIKYTEDEIEHRRELEKLKKYLDGAIVDQDISKIDSIITQIKELRDKSINLAFISTDSEALQNGSKHLALLRHKRALRGDIANNMPHLDLPLIPQNVEKISSAIERLEAMRNEARQFDDVFTERDNTTLNVTIANLSEAKKEMDRIKRKMDGLMLILQLPGDPENHESLKEAVSHMENVKAEAYVYDGLFGTTEDNVLQKALQNAYTLSDERKSLQEKIESLIPTLQLPMLPRNYSQLSEALEKVLLLRKRAIRFKNLFTADYESCLNQASEHVALLETKREELKENISKCMPDIGLSKFPAYYDRIKTAVEQMSEAKEESRGFEEIFTEKHAEILQKGNVNFKILQAEKEDIENDLKVCLPQLQLPMIPGNFEEISSGVKTLTRISALAKEFGLYEDEYDSILEKAIFNRDVLAERKEQIQVDIEKVKVALQLQAVPDNLVNLRLAVEKMKTLKESSSGFENLFTNQNESELFEATANLEQLTKKVEKLNEARHKLDEAVIKRNYVKLKHAIKRASRAPFSKSVDLKEPRKLLNFLDPKERCTEVKDAMEQREIDKLEEALMNMREAGVIDDSLEDQARDTLKKLHKQKKKDEKIRRKIERERARRQREMDKQIENVSNAIEARDIEILEQALNDFENSEFDEAELSIVPEAKQLLEHLKIERMRKRLQDGVFKRDFNMLLDALIDADYGKFETHLQKEYDDAKELLLHLQEMMRLRDAIAKMTRSSISEVHGYPKPPRMVKKIMMAIYIILGESPKELKKWVNIQALLGRQDRSAITKRVLRFKIQNLSPEIAEQAGTYLTDFSLGDAEAISSVAAMFYAWAKYVVNEMDFLQKEELRRQQQHEEAEQEDNSQNYDRDSFDSAHDDTSSEKSNEHDGEDHNLPKTITVDEAGYYADDDFA
ncbi:uncharacterized protein LOC120345745 [Styela clava]